MSGNEKNQLHELLERGKQTGKLSTKELYSVIDETDVDIDKLNEFLEANNIKIDDDYTVDEDLNKALEYNDDGEDGVTVVELK